MEITLLTSDESFQRKKHEYLHNIKHPVVITSTLNVYR